MSRRSAGRLWAEIAGWTFAAAAGFGTIAHLPVARRGGPGAVNGLWIGVGIAWLASVAGAIPLARALARADGPGGRGVAAIGRATVLRITVALGLALWAIAAELAPTAALLLAVAAGYLVLLAVETAWAMRRMRGERGNAT